MKAATATRKKTKSQALFADSGEAMPNAKARLHGATKNLQSPQSQPNAAPFEVRRNDSGEPVYEEIDGVICLMAQPSTNHNRVARAICHVFGEHLRGKRCEPFQDGESVYLTGKKETRRNTRCVPDAMIVCDPDKVHDDAIYGAPDLIVEVLSPGTSRHDRVEKLLLYERCGVREYWIVDPRFFTVEVYRLDESKKYPDAEFYALNRATPQEIEVALRDKFTVPLPDVFDRVAPPDK